MTHDTADKTQKVDINKILQRSVQTESWANENLPLEDRITLMAAAIQFHEHKTHTYRRRAIEAESQLLEIAKSSVEMIQVKTPDGKHTLLSDECAADDYITLVSNRDNLNREAYKKKTVRVSVDDKGRYSVYHQI